MLKARGRFSNNKLIISKKMGGMWGIVTTLEELNTEVYRRGNWKTGFEFCGITEDEEKNSFMVFKDNKEKEDPVAYFVELKEQRRGKTWE